MLFPSTLKDREKMKRAILWSWTMLLVLMALKVADASPVPDMMQLLRQTDIQNQLERMDMLLGKVAGDTDEAEPLPSIMEAAPKPEAIKSQLHEIDELMQRVMDLTNCSSKRPLTDDKEQEQQEGGGEQNTTPPTPTATTPSPVPEGDCDWAALSPNHTMLLEANTECTIVKKGLAEPGEKELVLEIHNYFRSKVAKGEENRGNPGPQPSAADMQELVWNDKLAKVAQAWANQCPHGHDEAKNRGVCGAEYPVGQNIHYYYGFDEEPNWQRAIEEWYDEVDYIPNTIADSFDLIATHDIAHYTQVVWAETREVGCGVVYYEVVKDGTWYPSSKTYVCNYGTAGNVITRPVYTQGPHASNCPNGVSTTYPALCA